MRILVTGAQGQLGQSLKKIAPSYPGLAFLWMDKTHLDITDIVQLRECWAGCRFDFCINTAAYTAVDKAEKEPDRAYAVNASGVAYLSEICREMQTVLLHISTDYVFDGQKRRPYTESDIPAPLNVYGASKLAGERLLQESHTEGIIIRTSWLYSEYGTNFMKTIRRLLSERQEISVVSDQSGSPTYASDLAEALLQIIQHWSCKKYFGDIFHYANTGEVSWFLWAAEIKEQLNCATQLVPIPTADYRAAASRPLYSVLETKKIQALAPVSVKEWRISLTKALLC